MDSKSIGVSQRRFEPCRLRVAFALSLSVPIIVPSKAFALSAVIFYELLRGGLCGICSYIKRNRPALLKSPDSG